MLLHLVLSAQLAANVPSRAEVVRPCADVSALCRISPFFCPGTYPVGLEPCWPDASRQPRQVPGGRASGTASTHRALSAEAGKADRSATTSRSVTRPAKPTLQQER
ncbi:MAG: hypothetical protein WAU32_02665 [Thermoanaerobaculia bacterium]